MTIHVTPIPKLIDFATPSITIGATAAAGDALTAIRSNSTIAGVALITSVDNAIARFSGTAGQLQGYTSNTPTIADDGLVLTPGQPAFLAYNGSTVNNVTGNNTQYTGVFGTEVFDQNADFDGTSTFTAPVTGRYRLSAGVGMGGVTTSGTRGRLRLVTSNRTYEYYWNPGAQETTTDGLSCSMIDALADMDASDTATITVLINGEGSDVCDWAGSGELFTYFQGELVA